MIGHHLGRDGSAKPKPFYFGSASTVPKPDADRQARALKAFWDALEAKGQNLWSDLDIAAARRFADGDATDPTVAAKQAQKRLVQTGLDRLFAPLGGLNGCDPDRAADMLKALEAFPHDYLQHRNETAAVTFHGVMRSYLDQLDASATVGDATAASVRSEVENAILLNIPDFPIKKLDAPGEVGVLVSVLCRRETGRSDGRLLSPTTIIEHRLKHVAAGLRHAEETGTWSTGPRRWEKHFKIRPAHLLTEDEKAEADIARAEAEASGVDPERFTIAELSTLSKAAVESGSDWMMMIFLAALVLGMGQMELSRLRRGVIQFNNDGTAVIRRRRGKTDVYGRHFIPAVLAGLFRKALSGEGAGSPHDRVFTTKGGKPLVYWTINKKRKKQRVDNSSCAWRRLLDRCPQVRRLPFYALRKTSATLITELTMNDILGEMHLQHSARTLATRRYIARTERQWERLVEAQREAWTKEYAAIFNGEAALPTPRGHLRDRGGRLPGGGYKRLK